MKRILQGFVSNKYGGISQYIYNNYLFLNKEKIQYDFLYIDGMPYYSEECKLQGGRFYLLPSKKCIFEYCRDLYNIIKNNNYEYVYFNMSYADCIPVVVAKLAGVSKIILHAHATGIDDRNTFKRCIKLFYHYISKIIIKNMSIKAYFACSDNAANFVFGKKVLTTLNYSLMKNAIDTKKYVFNENKRLKLRKKFNISDGCFVVGNVGRFAYSKNHEFLIDIFQKIVFKYPDSKLMLVGRGEYEENIKNKIQKLGLVDKVLFLGYRDDVADLMQAMDCFVLTSRFEGLGIVGIEAQAAGLPCIVSDACPPEIKITNLVTFCHLTDTSELWSNVIIAKKNMDRKDRSKEIINAGYDIEQAVKEIEIFIDNN